MLLTGTSTLESLRDSAVTLRDSAESFIVTLDSAIADAPKDLPSVMEALKEEIISQLAGQDVARTKRAAKTTTASTAGGTQCPYCPKVLKNDLGLSIHIGREHADRGKKAGKKAGRAARRSVNGRRKASTPTPTESVTASV